jgi:hypothetical protein
LIEQDRDADQAELGGEHGREQDAPAQRSSERKYGKASRNMVDSDETKPLTGTSDGLCRRPDHVVDAGNSAPLGALV